MGSRTKSGVLLVRLASSRIGGLFDHRTDAALPVFYLADAVFKHPSIGRNRHFCLTATLTWTASLANSRGAFVVCSWTPFVALAAAPSRDLAATGRSCESDQSNRS